MNVQCSQTTTTFYIFSCFFGGSIKIQLRESLFDSLSLSLLTSLSLRIHLYFQQYEIYISVITSQSYFFVAPFPSPSTKRTLLYVEDRDLE